MKRWKKSGQATAAFAAEIGVNPRTLAYWRWKLGRDAERRSERREPTRRPRSQKRTPSIQLVELIAPENESNPGEAFEVICANGVRVRVPARFEAESLSQLLAIVGLA